MIARARRAIAAVITAAGVVVAASTCSLGNLPIDDCTGDTECVGLFGSGSRCVQGACTAAPKCSANDECRTRLGYGARCQAETCSGTALDARCRVIGPEAVVAALGAGTGTKDAVVLGGIFDMAQEKEQARAGAVELAIEDMNAQGGTKPLALVMCDSSPASGPSAAVELARYLAEDVGTPAIVGPSTTQAVGDVATALYEGSRLAEVIVTPAATGLQLRDQPDSVAGSPGLLYRTCLDDRIQASALAAEIEAENEGKTGSILVIYGKDQYGASYQDVLSETLPGPMQALLGVEYDGTIEGIPAAVASAETTAAEATVQPILAVAVVSNRVDITLALLKGMKPMTAFANSAFFLTDGSKDRALAADSTAAAALAWSIGVAPKESANAGLFDRIKQRTTYDPSQYSFVSSAYDAAFVVGFGVAYANLGGTIDGPSIATGIGKLSDTMNGELVAVGTTEFKKGIGGLTNPGTINLQGISGPIDFDAKGDIGGSVSDMEVWCVRNGRIVTGKPNCVLPMVGADAR